MLNVWEKQLVGGGLVFEGLGLKCPLGQCKQNEMHLWGPVPSVELRKEVETIPGQQWRKRAGVPASSSRGTAAPGA